MRTLNEHIKTGKFKNVYLLYGPEVYLRKQYRDKLKTALIGDDDTMNYNYFEGKGLDVKSIISLAETMPFFAERRLIIIENSGFFSSSQEELADYIKQMPDTTFIIFAEENADKRNKLYKTVSSVGYAANMASPDEKTLKRWIGSIIRQEGKNVSERTVEKFLDTVDNDMENIRQELEKLLCYTVGKDIVDEDDVAQICSVHTENKIFEMINNVAMKKQREALRLYDDLLTLKEPAMRILYLIARQFNTLLQIKELAVQGFSSQIIAERTGMKEFVVRKNMGLTRKFSIEELKEALTDCVRSEEAVKTGIMNDQMAVELIIIRYSA